MSHIEADRLAALADDAPNVAESEHLAACSRCRGEMEAYRSLSVAALALRDGDAPLTRWESLAPRLREEGLISAGSGAYRRWTGPVLRAAAVILLVLGGVVAGRYSAPVMAAGQVALEDEGTPEIRSADEAQALLARATRDYQLASGFLAAQENGTDLTGRSEFVRTRLAALDEIAQVAGRAVNEAPLDPVLSQFYVSTLASREVALQQLGSALPAGVQLSGF